MENYTLLILPSISAIFIKIIILWCARYSLSSIGFWPWMFFLGLFGMNAIELYSFLVMDSITITNQYALNFLTLYYVGAITACVSFSALCFEVSGRLTYIGSMLLASIIVIGLLVTILPNVAISGVEFIGYSYTRVAGPFYWVLQMIIPGSWILGLAILIFATLSSNSEWLVKRRSLAIVIASLPIVMGVLVVVSLMALDYKMNATLIFSIATNVLLAVLIYTEKEHRLFRFLSVIPTTKESRLVNSAIHALINKANESLSEKVQVFERALILDSLKHSNGNQSVTARTLGISRATLRRKLE